MEVSGSRNFKPHLFFITLSCIFHQKDDDEQYDAMVIKMLLHEKKL